MLQGFKRILRADILIQSFIILAPLLGQNGDNKATFLEILFYMIFVYLLHPVKMQSF